MKAAIRLQRVLRPKSIGISSLRMGPFYTVASVELGNTTTKAILVTTNLETAEIFEIEKEVRMTRDVRPPLPNEEIFGETIFGVPLTQESVAEMISSILTSVLRRSKVDIEKDLHFVVRSTGVTAGFASPEEVGSIVKALAEGCLRAGIPPRKMTASLTTENLPPSLHDFTWLKKVYFDGAIASSLPPSNTEIVANEMEGELVTAGLKGAVKGTDIDFRNPVMTLDFGTTLAGRITDNGFPYAKTIGSFAGLGGAIPDAIIRGSGLVPPRIGCVLDISKTSGSRNIKVDSQWVDAVHEEIDVERVPRDSTRYGTVPVNPLAAEESNVVLIGINADLVKLEGLGSAIIRESNETYLLALIDRVQASIVQRIVTIAETENLILGETSLGLTGRAITTGQKPSIIAKELKLHSGNLWTDSHQLVFVEDGLAMGAAVAARCMNSMGTTRCPMGGRAGDRCIMAERMKLQSKK
ncbi:methanogenesis marker 14 protein [Candidatus Thorarchaeota archaeon]|nr:MAG: methanogenesis marker 14 protein [Candidatus Thorarchaeota archaeon]